MIRPARTDEADAVRDLVLAAYQRYVPIIGTKPGPMLDDYGARIAASQVWVLEDAHGIAGIVVLENGPNAFVLDNIAVAPGRQGQGIGRQLLDFAETEAARLGWDHITLYTNALMTENIAIYSTRGYRELERRTEKGFSRIYMAKRLTAAPESQA